MFDQKIQMLGFQLFMVLVSMQWIAPAAGQDEPIAEVRELFSQKKIPWYDANSDSVKSRDLGSTERAASLDRNTIPERQPAEKKKQKSQNQAVANNPQPAVESVWAGILPWILLAVILAALTAILMWAFFKRESSGDRLRSAPQLPVRTDAERIEQLPFNMKTAQGDLRARAQQALAYGDYKLAAILLFSFVLISLDRRGLVRLRKGKTNRDYLRDIFRFKLVAGYFQKVMVPFEDAFFGDHDVELSHLQLCLDQLDEFLRSVDHESKVMNS